jgi:hypothetical protein
MENKRAIKLFPKIVFSFFLGLFALFAFSVKSDGDMGQVSVTAAKVSEDSQKAIIFHNFEEEVLILGTDLKAQKKTGIIRFIPFPSEPTVRLAPERAFEAAAKLIEKHGLKFIRMTRSGPPSAQAVELRFNQKLGAHDLAVIKVNDASGFRKWVNDFFEKKGLPQKSEYPEVETIVNDYVRRAISWFVFDFVEVTEETRFIEPVEYRFKTKNLYYPLKASNTFGGRGGIDLILVLPGTLFDAKLDHWSCFGIPGLSAATSAQTSPEELKAIYSDAGAFFGGRNIFIQFLKYLGEYKFNEDILADPSQAVPYAIEHKDIKDRPGIKR